VKILDACCGKRAFWYNKKYPGTIYIDVRESVKPDVVMDCRNTTFKDKSFDLIVFDPPHDSFSSKNQGIFYERYGGYTAKEMRSFIRDAFIEFSRILKDDGFLVFKWNTHSQQLKAILPLIQGFEVLFGQLTVQRTKHSSQTYWFMLRKKNVNRYL